MSFQSNLYVIFDRIFAVVIIFQAESHMNIPKA